MPFLERDDSLLIAIDIQPGFYASADLDEPHPFGPDGCMARAAWLTAVAARLGVPVIVTEEDPAYNGGTLETLLEALPEGAPVLTKPVFNLADCEQIREAVVATGRTTAVLVGMETDVCVAHSALGLAELGYRAVVVSDATFSPGEMHALGLRRMREGGIGLNHTKGVFYEWVRTLAATRELLDAAPGLLETPGFAL